MTRKPLLVFAVASTALAPVCGSSSDGAAARQQRPALRVRVSPVAVQDVVYQIKALGQIEARDMVQVTAQVEGVATDVRFREGDRVGPGTVLLRIDPDRYNLEAESAQAIRVAYMVLATQFNAFTHPLTVLLALPFSISGALVALWVSGQSLNIYSMLGLILLMGIAKKNSILLVDFTNQIRERGAGCREALLQACPIRLRPILMTSVATIAGALPPALAIGPGAELQRPMALSIVGGMIVSTALTLFVVPSAYSLLDDALAWNHARRRRGEGLFAALRAARTS